MGGLPADRDLTLTEKPRSSSFALTLTPAVTGLLAAAAFAVAVCLLMPNRHLYDDETINVGLIHRFGLFELFRAMERFDVHPPLQYLANDVVYLLTGSVTAILWVNACFVLAAVWFMCASWASRVEASGSRLALALWVGLNPSLLLWCVSVRWYAYWVPISMALVTVLYLRERRPSTLWLAAALTVLDFYFGYLTLMLIAAIVAVEWIGGRLRPTPRVVKAAIVSFLAILPQLWIMVTVHMKFGQDQTSHQPLKVIGGAVSGALMGPSIFPTSAFAVVFALGLLGVAGYLVWVDRCTRRKSVDPTLVLCLAFTLICMLVGVSVKERNLALVNVVLPAWVAVNLYRLPKPALALAAALGLVFLGISTEHVVASNYTGKPSLNLPVRDVEAEIRADAARRQVPVSDVWVVTWNQVFTYYGKEWGVRLASPFTPSVDKQNREFRVTIPAGKLVVVLHSEQQQWSTSEWVSVQQQGALADGALSRVYDKQIRRDPNAAMETRLTHSYFPPFMVDYRSGISTRPVTLTWRQEG